MLALSLPHHGTWGSLVVIAAVVVTIEVIGAVSRRWRDR